RGSSSPGAELPCCTRNCVTAQARPGQHGRFAPRAGALSCAFRRITGSTGGEKMSNQIRDESGLSTAEYVATGDRPNESQEQPIGSRGGAAMAREEPTVQLFNETEAHEMRHRWSDIQTAFVDDPRTAVKQADELVGSATKRLAEVF